MNRTVYRIDPTTNFFMYTVDVAEGDGVPGNCVCVQPPAIEAGQLLIWESTIPFTDHRFGQKGTGQWLCRADNRSRTLILIETGTEYEIGTDHRGLTYHGVGSIPDWLTTETQPSAFHKWIDSRWVLDQDAFQLHQAALARRWRDLALDAVLWIRDRHRDEAELGVPTSIDQMQFDQLQGYIQALRDWPVHPEFPAESSKPLLPEWLAQ